MRLPETTPQPSGDFQKISAPTYIADLIAIHSKSFRFCTPYESYPVSEHHYFYPKPFGMSRFDWLFHSANPLKYPAYVREMVVLIHDLSKMTGWTFFFQSYLVKRFGKCVRQIRQFLRCLEHLGVLMCIRTWRQNLYRVAPGVLDDLPRPASLPLLTESPSVAVPVAAPIAVTLPEINPADLPPIIVSDALAIPEELPQVEVPGHLTAAPVPTTPDPEPQPTTEALEAVSRYLEQVKKKTGRNLGPGSFWIGVRDLAQKCSFSAEALWHAFWVIYHQQRK